MKYSRASQGGQMAYYTDTLALVGFGDTLSHDVKIYSVGKNEKESGPLSVNVKRLSSC